MVTLSAIARCGDLRQGDIPIINGENEVPCLHTVEEGITHRNQVIISAVMEASAKLEDEIIPAKIKECISFSHDGLDLKLCSTTFVFLNRLECVEAACIVLSHKVYSPR